MSRYRIYLTIIFSLLISFFVKAQVKTNFGLANADINICGNISKSAPPNGVTAEASATATSEKGNASASFVASPGLKLQSKSQSKLFGLSCGSNAYGSWTIRDLAIQGNNSVSVPVNFNFQISGSTQITTTQGVTFTTQFGQAVCLSIAGINTSYAIRYIGEGNTGEKKAGLQIYHQNGYVAIYRNTGITLQSTIKYEPKLNIDGELISLKDFISSFSDCLNIAILADEYLDILERPNGIQVTNLPQFNNLVAGESAKLLDQIIKLKLTGGNICVPTVPGILLSLLNASKVSIEHEFTYDYNFKNTVSIPISNKVSFLEIFLNTISVSIASDCLSQATNDFSSTFELESVTVPVDFQNENIDFNNLKLVTLDGYEFPITREQSNPNEDTSPPTVLTTDGSLDRILNCSNNTELNDALNLAPTATDNCNCELIFNQTSDITNYNCNNSIVRTRSWNFIDPAGNTSNDFIQTITINNAVEAGNNITVCNNKLISLSELGSCIGGGNTTNAFWTVMEGDDSGLFLDNNGNPIAKLEEGFLYNQAISFKPNKKAAERGYITLQLKLVDNTQTNTGDCQILKDEVKINILNTDCGQFPWKGN